MTTTYQYLVTLSVNDVDADGFSLRAKLLDGIDESLDSLSGVGITVVDYREPPKEEATRDDYLEHVRDCAAEYLKDIKAGEYTREDFLERLHEDVDSDRWVIYTHLAQLVLTYSSNDGAYFDNFRVEGATDKNGIRWSALAYAALEQDILDELGHYVDVDDDEIFTASVDEEDEEEGDDT